MNYKISAKILLPLVFLTFTFGCSTVKGQFGKYNNESNPPDVLAEDGIKDLEKKKNDDAIDNFEKVKDRYPYSEQALSIQIKLADAYFNNKKYNEAFQAYKEFEKLHPTDKAVPHCVYRQGLCYYLQRSHIDCDQTYTTMALKEFKRLKNKYPQSEYIPEADKYLAQCRQDLGEHEYHIAEFYYRTKRFQAAIERYQTVVQEYPDFHKKTEALERIDECQKVLATTDKKSNLGFFAAIANLFDAKW